jgi:dolichyl-phosphate-mannose-protein mannosyltransferase
VDLEVKNALSRIYRWEYFWLCLIVIAVLAMHFSIINNPNDLVLDEQHYVKDARSIITTQVDQRPEHPPLAKLFIVGGMDVFGDNQWGWRFPSVIVGTIGIVLFYFICRRLKMSRTASSLATFLLGFETFTFLMSSLAMLDVFYVTLMLAFFLLYLYREYLLSGIFVGLSALAKLYGALGTPVILLHWLFTRTKHNRWFLLTVIAAPLSFVALMPLFDFAITHEFQNPIFRIKDMLSLSGSLTFANTVHPALSRPWAWLLNYNPMAFWYTPHYTGAVSLTVWVVMIPVVLYILYLAVKRNEAGLFGFSWFFGIFLLWIPISIVTDRVSFIYYFYPAIGALCLGLGLGLAQALEWVSVKSRKVKIPVTAGVVTFLVLHVVVFVILTPVFFRT